MPKDNEQRFAVWLAIAIFNMTLGFWDCLSPLTCFISAHVIASVFRRPFRQVLVVLVENPLNHRDNLKHLKGI
jgi:hypothetical protein